MALPDYKINAFSKPVSALGDTPQMSAAELKEWFDSNSTNELKNSVNGIIDETVAELSGKVDKTEGKDLSTNDYTNEEKQKVALAVTQDELEGAIADLINGAPEALDTLKELGDALALHEDAYDALLEMVGNKANKTELDAYATKKEIENGTIQTRHSQTADLAYYADYADGAGQATSATTDAMDNDIIATYATKAELGSYATKAELGSYATKAELENGTIQTHHSQTADLAFNSDYADFAGYATSATTDAMDNDIIATYATKEELPKWKTLIDTTLTEEQSGAAALKLEITEDISQMQEFNFYIEFPITAENENTSLYVSAYINSTLSGNNSFFHTYTSTKGVSGKTYCAMSNSKVINISGRKEILTFHSMIGDKTVVGNGTRGYAVSAHAPWVIPQDTPLYLTVNTSTTTFLSGTKIFLEGR